MCLMGGPVSGLAIWNCGWPLSWAGSCGYWTALVVLLGLLGCVLGVCREMRASLRAPHPGLKAHVASWGYARNSN